MHFLSSSQKVAARSSMIDMCGRMKLIKTSHSHHWLLSTMFWVCLWCLPNIICLIRMAYMLGMWYHDFVLVIIWHCVTDMWGHEMDRMYLVKFCVGQRPSCGFINSANVISLGNSRIWQGCRVHEGQLHYTNAGKMLPLKIHESVSWTTYQLHGMCLFLKKEGKWKHFLFGFKIYPQNLILLQIESCLKKQCLVSIRYLSTRQNH